MADLAKAYVQIIPSATGIKGALGKELGANMPESGKSAGGLFGSSLVSTVKNMIVAAGIGKALTDTIMAGAELQQSLGGVETLFKENAATVIANAEQAYRTAGMSANAYMEQVTSFSASLLQSLGGDTAAAASVADMALQDMSDNANKFGTDMERITDAYQGFAKQNYTMLDNLKLGYGGTKTEMERLLADAQELTGIEYDINSLNDVYQAIHAIQGELDITGTTANEAATTLTGSFNAMKASFTNVLANLTLGRDLGPSLNSMVQTTVTFLQGNLLPAVMNIFTALPGAVGTLLKAMIPGNVGEVVQSLVTRFTGFMNSAFPTLLSNGTAMLTQLMAGFQLGMPEIAATVSGLMAQILTTIVMSLPGIFQSGITILQQLALGLIAAIPTLLTSTGTVIDQLLQSFMLALPSILSTGMSFILTLASGLINSLPNVVSSATTVVANLLSTFASHLPELLAQGISMIGQLVAGLISMIPDVIEAALDIGQDIINTFGEIDWLSIGSNIISGIVRGIWNAAGSLFNALKDLASQALQAAKDALGIASPSKKFQELVGKFIPAGVAQGVLGNLNTVKQAMRSMSDAGMSDFTAALRINAAPTQSGLPGQKNTKGAQIILNIYSKAQTAADLMQEARYQAEMAVLYGV